MRRILINALSVSQGGGRSYLSNLTRELGRDSRGFRFTLLVARGRFSSAELHGAELETVAFPKLASPAKAAVRVLYEELALPLRAGPFDLLYCPADLSPAFAPVPTVVALRNLNIYDRRFYDDLRTRTLRRCVRVGLRRARRILCPSRAAARLIAPLVGVPEERITVVPHGVSSEAFCGSIEPVPSEAPYLFASAALERHKNLAVAIEALALLGDSRLELWIAGGEAADPVCARELRALAARLGLRARVRFLGHVPYRQIGRYYRGACGFVFPSLIETFGHPLLEAMLAGTPVVASDIPTFREVAGDVALYFDPTSPRSLAEAVERQRADPDAARRRVELGRARAASFSWSASTDRLCQVFEQALGACGEPDR